MILPDDMAASIVQILETNKVTLGIKGAHIGSEDLAHNDIQPPYCIVYSNFEEEGKVMTAGNPADIPVEIKIVCTSSEHLKVEDSSREAFLIAVQALRLVQGDYNVDSFNGVEAVKISSKGTPLTFGVKSAALTSVIVHLQYEIDIIHEDYN